MSLTDLSSPPTAIYRDFLFVPWNSSFKVLGLLKCKIFQLHDRKFFKRRHHFVCRTILGASRGNQVPTLWCLWSSHCSAQRPKIYTASSQELWIAKGHLEAAHPMRYYRSTPCPLRAAVRPHGASPRLKGHVWFQPLSGRPFAEPGRGGVQAAGLLWLPEVPHPYSEGNPLRSRATQSPCELDKS